MPAWAQVSVKPGETVVFSVHAVGAQVYDCKAGEGGKLAWQLREPIATLIQDGETVGRHYKGPTWEHADESRIRGKQVDTQPGETVKDIPWLRLDAIEAGGSGVLAGITAILRINTKGGQLAGACDKAGTIMANPLLGLLHEHRESAPKTDDRLRVAFDLSAAAARGRNGRKQGRHAWQARTGESAARPPPD
jgi:Protein of unknown function (DUF3455)